MTTRRKFLQGVGAAVIVPFLPAIPTPENERNLLSVSVTKVVESQKYFASEVVKETDYTKYWDAYLQYLKDAGYVCNFTITQNVEPGLLDVWVRYIPPIDYFKLAV